MPIGHIPWDMAHIHVIGTDQPGAGRVLPRPEPGTGGGHHDQAGS